MSPYNKDDKLFVRTYLETFRLGEVLRWRTEGQSLFRSQSELRRMDEDLLQHCAGMQLLDLQLRAKAYAENDSSITDLDHFKVSVMIYLHDGEEVLIGDARDKDDAYKARETWARDKIYNWLKGTNWGHDLVEIAFEYLQKHSPEAKYVKALDEVQAWGKMIVRQRLDASTRDFRHGEGIVGYQYALEFPTFARVSTLMYRHIRRALHKC